MVKLSEDERERQSPGYATLTLASVTVQNGIEDGVGEFTGTFAVDGFENVKVNGPDIREDSSVSKVFAIGIHSVDQGFPGVGSGEVGDASSLIGLKILQVGGYSDVEIPIYPVYTLTDVQADVDGPLSQRFPPRRCSARRGNGAGSSVYRPLL